MSQEIVSQPRLYAADINGVGEDSEALARIHRLISLQQSIARRPEIYLTAFTELGKNATSETLDLHDDSVQTRGATKDPKQRIKEYFAKRDDKELSLDEASEDAIFGTDQFRELAKASVEKRSLLKKTGVMRTVVESHPEAREASNAVRRYILGQYLGRAVIWKTQHTSKRINQAV